MKNRILYTAKFLVLSFVFFACENQKAHEDAHEHGHEEEESYSVHLSQQQVDAIGFRVGAIPKRNMAGVVRASGTLEVPPQNEASVTNIIGAIVQEIKVIEGDEVKKGQTLAIIAHPDIIQLQSDYMNAYNQVGLLSKEYDRQKTLYENKVGSGQKYQTTEAALAIARAKVQAIQLQLKLMNIATAPIEKGKFQEKVRLTSPIDGFVQKVEANIGQFVQPQQELFEIVNTHHVHADLMVFEKDVHKVKEGQKVRFTTQSMPNRELIASIYSVSKTFEQDPKAVHVHAEIENKGGELIPGMYIKGEILLEAEEVLALPSSAMVQENNQFFIFKESNTNKNEFIPIEVVKVKEYNNWVAIQLIQDNGKGNFVLNSAYYLMAELKKAEAEHSH